MTGAGRGALYRATHPLQSNSASPGRAVSTRIYTDGPNADSERRRCMSPTETIRSSGDVEELVRSLVEQAIESQDTRETVGLTGALVLRPGETLDPSFLIKMPHGRQFLVIVRELGTANALAI